MSASHSLCSHFRDFRCSEAQKEAGQDEFLRSGVYLVNLKRSHHDDRPRHVPNPSRPSSHFATGSTGSPSRRTVIAGRVISGLGVAFLTFDAVVKLLMLAPRSRARALGYPRAPSSASACSAVLLIAYLVPRSAVLGAILWTGYLGGAVATMFASKPAVQPRAFSRPTSPRSCGSDSGCATCAWSPDPR